VSRSLPEPAFEVPRSATCALGDIGPMRAQPFRSEDGHDLQQVPCQRSPEFVRAAIKDVGSVHTRLAQGFVTATVLDGDVRTVRSANGFVAKERIVTVSDGSTCMSTRIRDYTPLLKEAIAQARAAGFETAADDLDKAAFSAFTTASEMLQEHGLAIKRFLEATHDTLPPSIKAKVQACLTETELARTGWRNLVARLRRRHALD